MPTLENNRELHGVIFLRRGLYRNGVFRFKVMLPNAYNSVDSHPLISFDPPIFNPLVDPAVQFFAVATIASSLALINNSMCRLVY